MTKIEQQGTQHSLTSVYVSASFGLDVEELLGRLGQRAEAEEDGCGDNDGMKRRAHFGSKP